MSVVHDGTLRTFREDVFHSRAGDRGLAPVYRDVPYGHSGFGQTDLWLPIANTPFQKSDRSNFESADAAIGRLRRGVSADEAHETYNR